MSVLNSILLQQEGSAGGGWSGMLMIVAMLVIFYFFMIRPQQRQQKKLRQQRDAIQKGDRVVTAGGIHGKVKGVKDSTLLVEVAPDVVITVEKQSITPIPQGQEVKVSAEDK